MIPGLDDIRSDFSVFHRIDDLEDMPADRFWAFVDRLAFYGGVVAAKFRYQHRDTPASVSQSQAAPQVGAPVITADNAEDILANPLYGEVPGLAAVFSHSRV